MKTRLLVRPQPPLRVLSTGCEADLLVLYLDGPQGILRSGSVLTLQLEGRETVQCLLVTEGSTSGSYITDLLCTGAAFGCPGGVRLADLSGPSSTYVQTSSGYLTYTVYGQGATTIGTGVPYAMLGPITTGPGDQLCFYPSGASGEDNGSLVSFIDSSSNVTTLDLTNASSLTWLDVLAPSLLVEPDFCLCPYLVVLTLQDWPFPTIDIACLSYLESFTCQNTGLTGALTALDFSGCPTISYIYCPGQSLASSDDTINSINPATAGGYLDIMGGTSAPRTSASDTVWNALAANGWTLFSN